MAHPDHAHYRVAMRVLQPGRLRAGCEATVKTLVARGMPLEDAQGAVWRVLRRAVGKVAGDD